MVYRFYDRLETQHERFAEINPDVLGAQTYRRISTGETATINASLGQSDLTEIIPGVSQTTVQYLDFFVDQDEMNFSGTDFVPEAGDEIERADGTKFRVVLLNGEAYNPITANRNRFRIHTERIS